MGGGGPPGPPRGGPPPFMGDLPLVFIPIKLPALIFRPPITLLARLPVLIFRPPITLLARPPLITDPLLGPPPLRLVTLPLSSGGIMSPSTTSRDLDFFFFFLFSSLPSLITSSSGMGGGGGDCIIICRGRLRVDNPDAEERKLLIVLP